MFFNFVMFSCSFSFPAGQDGNQNYKKIPCWNSSGRGHFIFSTRGQAKNSARGHTTAVQGVTRARLFQFIGVPDPEGELKLVVKMSDGQSSGVSNAWGKTVIISPDKVPDWGEIDLTDAFKAVMGHSPINGQKYFVELYWIDPVTGFTGVPVQVSWICQDGSAHTGRAMAKRTTFKNSDVLDDDKNYITDMDVEFAQGSTIVTADIKYDATKHDVQEAMCHISKAAYDRAGGRFTSIMLGRSNANAGYMPHFFTMYTYPWGSDYEFKCAKRGGMWGKIGEVFGTSLTFEFVN